MTATHTDVFAGILVGGHGRRLGGVTKALLHHGGQTLLSRMAQAVRPAVCDVVVARRADQTFPMWTGRSVVDACADAGPLAALVALLRAAPAPWCWLLAVDMPHVTAALLSPLMAQCSPTNDAVVYTRQDAAEPLCALYHVRCLPAATAALSRGAGSLRRLLQGLAHTQIAMPHDHYTSLFNVNSTADLAVLNSRGAS